MFVCFTFSDIVTAHILIAKSSTNCFVVVIPGNHLLRCLLSTSRHNSCDGQEQNTDTGKIMKSTKTCLLSFPKK